MSSQSGCQTLAYDSHGQIWVRIAGDVSIYRLNPHTNADTLIEKDAGNFTQSAFSKEIICLTHHDGIKIWSSGGQLIETYNHPKLNVYIDYAYHHQITTDSKGRIWLGAHNGLISFERGANWQNTIRQWTTENGLPSNTIYDMAGDPRGGAWVIAEGGLVYVDTIGQLTIYNFNRNVLPDWKNVGIQIDAKGEAFIKADLNYYYQFHTDQIRPLSIAATQIAFNDFRLFGKPISLEKDINYLSEISLNHNQNTFSVVFGAVGCLESEALRYSYRLVGLDTNWIDNGNNRYVAFSNLEPRAYELQVRVSAVFGQWSDEYKSLKINIQPAIWQTLSFKIIAWAAFIGLLILGVRLYVRQQIRTERRRQEAIERERERIFDEIHDELGSYLTRIKYKADNIVNDFVTMNLTTLHTAVTNLSNITIDALERMNDIIQEIRAPDDSLHNFTADLRAWVIGVCNDAHINCRCAIPPLEDKLLIGMVRHNLLLTVKQALRNTTQHASASAVIISIQCKDNLEIIIQDNGKGFNPATVKNQSSGLRSMHKRMNKIGGTIEIQSTIGVGTTIRLSVPIHT